MKEYEESYNKYIFNSNSSLVSSLNSAHFNSPRSRISQDMKTRSQKLSNIHGCDVDDAYVSYDDPTTSSSRSTARSTFSLNQSYTSRSIYANKPQILPKEHNEKSRKLRLSLVIGVFATLFASILTCYGIFYANDKFSSQFVSSSHVIMPTEYKPKEYFTNNESELCPNSNIIAKLMFQLSQLQYKYQVLESQFQELTSTYNQDQRIANVVSSNSIKVKQDVHKMVTNANDESSAKMMSYIEDKFKDWNVRITDDNINNIKSDVLSKCKKLVDKQLDADRLVDQVIRQLPDTDNGRIVRMVEDNVRQSLKLYDADKTGMIDYAMYNIGGRVHSMNASSVHFLLDYNYFGIRLFTSDEMKNGPINIIRPSVNPGDCWVFHNSSAHVILRLQQPIYLSSVTLEHIPKAINPDVSSAPKDFSVYGVRSTSDPSSNRLHLGSFQYDVEANPQQNYNIRVPVEEKFEYVKVDFETNWGNVEYTCVYRFRVHGSILSPHSNAN